MNTILKKYEELTLDELYKILKLRSDVFIVEQQCAYGDLDLLDQKALHLWMEDEDGIQAYIRILDRGLESDYLSFSRVISLKRRQGIATKLLKEAIQIVHKVYGEGPIYLEGQLYVKDLYDKLGFKEISGVIEIDGIPHVKMLLG